jgi:hypothetical protein
MKQGSPARLLALIILGLTLAVAHLGFFTHGTTVDIEAKPEVDWLELARSAWNYFQPGVGLSNRGLNYASIGWHFLTDWDLGCYISAIIDAEVLGLIPRDGPMGADDRVRRVLNFLASRPLHSDGVPYGVYNADTGEPGTSGPSNPSDAGRLLISLYRLKRHRPDLSGYIEFVIERNGLLKFASGVPNNGFYSYYYAHGYYLWGAKTRQVDDALGLIATLRSRKMVDAYGVKLPYVEITMEPILHSIFELDLPMEYFYWANLTLQAQINRYKATGKPTAFTEGGLTVPPYYIYEWIVDIYSGRTFTVWNPSLSGISLTPIIYTKAAIGMHAIWGNNYTLMLVNYVMKTKSPNGFYEGVDERGNMIYLLSDKTNSLIVNAARYALEKANPPTIVGPAKIDVYPGDTTTLHFFINHSLNLPVSVSVSVPGSALKVAPQTATGKTPLNLTLSLEVSNSTKPGTYTVIVTVKPFLAQPVSKTLAVIVQPPGYTLRIKALDACGGPAPNVTIILGYLTGTTSRDGTALFKHVNGTYTLTATLGGVPVIDPQTITLESDSEVVLRLRVYKVLVEAKTIKGAPADNVLIEAYVSDRFLSSALTNSSGKAILTGIPPGNITIRAFTGDRKVELGSWTISVRGDTDVLDPEIVIQSLNEEDT